MMTKMGYFVAHLLLNWESFVTMWIFSLRCIAIFIYSVLNKLSVWGSHERTKLLCNKTFTSLTFECLMLIFIKLFYKQLIATCIIKVMMLICVVKNGIFAQYNLLVYWGVMSNHNLEWVTLMLHFMSCYFRYKWESHI